MWWAYLLGTWERKIKQAPKPAHGSSYSSENSVLCLNVTCSWKPTCKVYLKTNFKSKVKITKNQLQIMDMNDKNRGTTWDEDEEEVRNQS